MLLIYNDSDVNSEPRQKDKNVKLLENYENNKIYVKLKLDKIKQIEKKRKENDEKEMNEIDEINYINEKNYINEINYANEINFHKK